jgi:hypothetical protein
MENLPALLKALGVTVTLSGLTGLTYIVLERLSVRGESQASAKTAPSQVPTDRSSVAADVQELARRQKEEKFRQTMEVDRLHKDFRAGLQQLPSDEHLPEAGLRLLCHKLEAGLGMIYTRKSEDCFVLKGAFAAEVHAGTPREVGPGDGLLGMVASKQQPHHISNVPPSYLRIQSGLGRSAPNQLSIFPLKAQGMLVGLVELASFSDLMPYNGNLTPKLIDALAERLAQLEPEQLSTPLSTSTSVSS